MFKQGQGFSLRDKRLFEISEVEVTGRLYIHQHLAIPTQVNEISEDTQNAKVMMHSRSEAPKEGEMNK